MFRRLVAATMLALGAAGCSVGDDGKLADAADAAFMRQIAAGQFQQAYQSAGPEFQSAMTADTFQGMMQRVDRKMGACGPPQKTFDTHVSITPAQFARTQGYALTCKNGPLGARLTVIVRGGRAKVAGFFVSSPLLLTD